MQIYVTQPIPEKGIELLKGEFDVETSEKSMVPTEDELVEKVKGKDAVLCLLTDKISARVLESADRAKVFSNYAVGYDNVDVEKATQLGIVITNTPGVLTDTTAELAWALLFAIARKIVQADRWTREGSFQGWGPLLFLGSDLKGKTLGVVGAGRIGTAFALKSVGFEMEVLYTDVRKNERLEKEINARQVPLKELLKNSDYISIHIPFTPETHHLIDEEELKMMKDTAFLINTSRGAVINESALVKGLKENWIQGAALDVFENEPQIHPELINLKNVVIVPHIGSATKETREKMAMMAAQNIIDVLRNKKPQNLVNKDVWERRRS